MVKICIEVILKLYIRGKEGIYSLVNKVEIVLLCSSVEDPWENGMELSWLDIRMIADAIEDLKLIV